jgi:hypothetical protein
VDNGKQFDSENFKEFYTSIGTKIAFASMYHPESNGAVERVNKIVFFSNLLDLVNPRKGKWIEELPKVVWSHNTIVSRATGFTPFRLLYGEEAMLPEEIKYPSLHTIRQAKVEDEEYSKETIEATRLEVVDNITKYQEPTKKWRDNQVVRKKHTKRRLGPQKKSKHGKRWKTLA